MPRERYAFLALFIGLLCAASLLSESTLVVYVPWALTAVVTVGVSLLMGQAGQVSLGHGAFYACGAYAAGILAKSGWPSWLCLAVAPVAASALAAVVGVPLLVLRGHHLAFATLATHLIALSLVGEATITGGDVGLQGIPPLQVGPLELHSVRAYAYLSSLALLAVVVVAHNVLDSRPGRALRALSTSEIGAAASGVPVGAYKLAVLALSAAFAGAAGGIYAFYMGYLAPGSFPLILSVEYVVMAAIGGLGTISGAVLGSAAVVVMVHALSRIATMSGMPDSAPIILSYAVYAVLLIAAVLFLPGGIASVLSAVTARIRQKTK